jgi:enterochelin esterase-like enzyme
VGKKEGQYEWFIKEIAKAEKKEVEFFLAVGYLEGEYDWKYPAFPHQIVSHRHLKLILELKYYDFTYIEYLGDHSYFCWRVPLKQGLLHYFKIKEMRPEI